MMTVCVQYVNEICECLTSLCGHVTNLMIAAIIVAALMSNASKNVKRDKL